MSAKAKFIPPMLLLKTDALPNDSGWRYELKLDGYRTIAFKSGGKLHLRSRNDKDFSERYARVVDGLAKLPEETVIDGEVVAFDQDRPAVVQRPAELWVATGARRLLRFRRHHPRRGQPPARAPSPAATTAGEEGPAEAVRTGALHGHARRSPFSQY